MNNFTLYPSLDIVGGQALTSQSAIRVTQGKRQQKKIIGSPLDIAKSYQNMGAKWIHIVDLDAASGKGNNVNEVINLIKSVGTKTQICGGIRNVETLETFINAGCDRVNIGSLAIDNPERCKLLLDKYGDRIAIALDVKILGSEHRLATQGWNNICGDLWQMIKALDAHGCRRYVVTDIDRGGMMNTPNLSLLKKVMSVTDTPIVSGGGVSCLKDIENLMDIGVEGTVLGQVLHTKSMSYEQFNRHLTLMRGSDEDDSPSI
ncbi:1-(5-phosphoribosyl)-5-[(5-phosphoribosylamino)methylideneamino] imidazole-4-carboxamide isomerase [Shewanella psychropiezotolerans]|uniref:1-(5-phosphoribosyl)-5-[(5-phosphoribosylamino)methylideneamino] imidazole-4-carboxamide isomerase n=1 Tax=Shewanella psychropiezotolerans TaxID=2593655 RepID=A0ABX5X0C6_9GAMM|nr:MULTISPECIES: HisA/HisF-related TIM barrel protein [Shewanella]MPY21589.1 1-(5-phosphoribosyl)-5-[(5-phosphoribosylamino)methylideneamino] imidazole-4-carboxamide isomerase [Shewanella sp. YLB-07]QDO84807.1 1-(5-phosphoribosyl)-5-[(5-phosphoribosylamino)methylideneamino] imidazole-4-carboxamide isomerase [Shewanella psychropiezotolerans]